MENIVSTSNVSLNKNNTCEICEKAYSTKQYLKKHFTTVHEGNKRIPKCRNVGNLRFEVSLCKIEIFLLLLKIVMNFRRWDALVLKCFLEILKNCLFLPYIWHFPVKYQTLLSLWSFWWLINQNSDKSLSLTSPKFI